MYQVVRIGSPRVCRFAPSCSEYLYQALVTHGFIRGMWSGLVRIVKCHPWNPGGYDPVRL